MGLAGLRQGRVGLGLLGLETGDGVVQRLGAGRPQRLFAFQLGDLLARAVQQPLGVRRAAPPVAQQVLDGAHPVGGGLQGGGGGVGARRQDIDLGLDLGQARALLQADRGGLGRVGAGHEAVPAPEVALAGDQAHPRLEVFLEPVAIGARHHGDVREAGRQGGRRLDPRGQRLGAFRPDRRGRLGSAPVGRRLGVQGRVQVVAQRRRQRRAIALVGRDAVQRRGVAALGARRGQLGQASGFGAQAA